MNNKINKFTTYKFLLETVKKGLYFSDGKDWPDKNDSKLLEIYSEHSKKEVRVACLMEEDETIYHWQSFANDSCTREVCCIEFDKVQLLSLYKESDGYISAPVDYVSIEDVVFDNPRKLLFSKRLPYRNEKEFRVVHIHDQDQKQPEVDVKHFRKTITKITLSGKLSEEEYNQRKEYLIKQYSFRADQINQSTVEENPFWINKAYLQSQVLDFNNETHSALKNELCIKEILRECGCLVRFHRMKSSKEAICASVVTVCLDDYVVAMGAVNEINPSRMNQIKDTLQFERNEPKYELSHFCIRDDYRGKNLYDIILRESLAYYGDEGFVADVRNNDKELIAALLKANFITENGITFIRKKNANNRE